MTLNGFLQLAIYFLAILVVTKPLGLFMAKIFSGEPTLIGKVLRPVERLIYRICRVDEGEEHHWTAYTAAMLMFNLAGLLLLYAFERLHYYLPHNPQGFTGVAPDLAFNTAVSFTTNTNWQAYSGESTMSYLTQMAALAYHNFVSAATGIALAVAFIRGIARRTASTLGNFWVDLTRTTLYVLLPFCVIGALVLVSQGVVQNFSPYTKAKLVEPQKIEKTGENGAKTTETVTEQTIAQGPVASQEIIKELGTNGGLFQRQLGSSLRKSHAADQLHRDVCHFRYRSKPDIHIGADDGQPETWLGRVCGHGSPFSGWFLRCVLLRSSR